MKNEDYNRLLHLYKYLASDIPQDISFLKLITGIQIGLAVCTVIALGTNEKVLLKYIWILLAIVAGVVSVVFSRRIKGSQMTSATCIAKWFVVNTVTFLFNMELLGLCSIENVTVSEFCLFLFVQLTVISMFWIIIRLANLSAIKRGKFRDTDIRGVKKWKVYLWGLSMIPFFPLASASARRVFIKSASDDIQNVVFIYMLI